MQIQKISFLSNKKSYQKDKNDNNKPSILILASMPRRHISRNDNASILIAASRGIAERRNDKINHYLDSSKKELKDIQKTALAHKKQCLGILKKAEKLGYTGTINCDDYNLTFGTIDPETNKPSVINIWEDGRMVQQYKINSIEPCNIEVYDCELETFNEEFSIIDGKLSKYVAIKPKENTIKMLIPLSDGFYKAEGEISYQGTYITDSFRMKKQREITYERSGFSYYTEFKNDTKSTYLFDSMYGNWKSI